MKMPCQLYQKIMNLLFESISNGVRKKFHIQGVAVFQVRGNTRSMPSALKTATTQ